MTITIMKPRFMLINKIIPHNLDRSAILRNLKNIQISYKHEESKYIVNVLNEIQQNKNDLNSELSFAVDRETFIQGILKSCISPEQEHNIETKKVVIDFSSPNIAKPFHAGHLRSTIIGNFIANINRYFGNNVVKLNYLGDWGTQFGLLQYGLKAQNINLSDLKSDPIKTLFDAYVYANKLAAMDDSVRDEARKYFSDIEQGRASLENWKKICDITIHELKKIYQRLGVEYDTYHWESDYNGVAIQSLMDKLETMNILKSDESGKKVININDKVVTVLKSDNSTLYISRDIAALLDRYTKYQFDKMLYIVDNAQTDHFTTLFEIVKQIDSKCIEGCEHIKFGRIKGMSTRTGNVVFLNDILEEAKRKMHEKQSASKNTRSTAMNEETCDILGTSAVLINDLKQRRQKDYLFEWDRALQSEGDSGIKLQYLHCRLWSLEKNCGICIPDICNPTLLPEKIIGDVITEIAKFENILQRSHLEYEACILVNYLFRLSKYVNRMFNEINVKNVDLELAEQRLLVFHSARLVVKNGLEILGIRPLKEM